MNDPGTVITFYSYKGGTGRTMALANAGVALAREGVGDVLMVDWDLEAPGLADFFPEVNRKDRAGGSPTPGVLELFEHANDNFGRRARIESDSEEVSPRAFWSELGLEKFVTPTDEPSLHLMRAGILNETYGARVNMLPWRELFASNPALFQSFADELSSRFRYVLIDSRTGLADSSGICTTLLPDRLVVVFTPNRQSLTGAVDLVRNATAYRGRSPDIRPLLVFPLASRVEMSEDELRREWRYGTGGTPGYQPAFERLFKEAYDLPECDLERYFDEVQVQHATSYAYGERVAIRDERSERLSLSRSYERFARTLLDSEAPWTFEAEPSGEGAAESNPDFVLARLTDAREEHEIIARRAKRADNLLIGAALAVPILGLISFISLYLSPEATAPAFAPWIAGCLIVAGATIGLRFWLGLGRRHAVHARAANTLGREPALFFAEAGPYANRQAPVAVLAERLTEIERTAEDLLLDPREPTRRLDVGHDELKDRGDRI